MKVYTLFAFNVVSMGTRRMPAFISSNTTSLKIKDAYQAACDLELDEMADQNQSL
jgi:hypothetical protein